MRDDHLGTALHRLGVLALEAIAARIRPQELADLRHAVRDRGCAEVFLEVREDNPRARGLYLRRGFEEIGVRRGYYQPSGVNAVVMRKELAR